MRRIPFASIILAISASILTGCAGGNPHFLPRTRPLFAGLDEQKLSSGTKAMLEQAKTDFQLARHGGDPHYARFSSTIPGTHSRVFEGKGYRLTLVNKDMIVNHYVGPQIVLNAAITGGKPFTYDEVNCLGD